MHPTIVQFVYIPKHKFSYWIECFFFSSIATPNERTSNMHSKIRGELYLLSMCFPCSSLHQINVVEQAFCALHWLYSANWQVLKFVWQRVKKKNEKLILICLSAYRLRWSLLNAITLRANYLKDILFVCTANTFNTCS